MTQVPIAPTSSSTIDFMSIYEALAASLRSLSLTHRKLEADNYSFKPLPSLRDLLQTKLCISSNGIPPIDKVVCFHQPSTLARRLLPSFLQEVTAPTSVVVNVTSRGDVRQESIDR